MTTVFDRQYAAEIFAQVSAADRPLMLDDLCKRMLKLPAFSVSASDLGSIRHALARLRADGIISYVRHTGWILVPTE